MDDHEHRLAACVLEYLDQHPNATDTIEGIARFWLSGEDTVESLEEVEKIVTELVDEGLVARRLKPDGGWLYHRGERGGMGLSPLGPPRGTIP